MNEPAIQKDKASGEYEVSLVYSDKISLIWDQIEKYLKKSASRSNGRTRVQDIFHDLLNKNSHLWIIFDTGSLDITGVQITLFNDYPTGKRMLCLEHTAGKNMQDWVEKLIDILTKFAKDNKCNGMEAIGRHGQWNWVKNKESWKRPATFYEYNFEVGT
jgi:hypothetical protein|tara:strand:- start:795 stop:1271 length:477 start_codon:yes stop_codon:yes gene_type:complete